MQQFPITVSEVMNSTLCKEVVLWAKKVLVSPDLVHPSDRAPGRRLPGLLGGHALHDPHVVEHCRLVILRRVLSDQSIEQRLVSHHLGLVLRFRCGLSRLRRNRHLIATRLLLLREQYRISFRQMIEVLQQRTEATNTLGPPEGSCRR